MSVTVFRVVMWSVIEWQCIFLVFTDNLWPALVILGLNFTWKGKYTNKSPELASILILTINGSKPIVESPLKLKPLLSLDVTNRRYYNVTSQERF